MRGGEVEVRWKGTGGRGMRSVRSLLFFLIELMRRECIFMWEGSYIMNINVFLYFYEEYHMYMQRH